MFSFDLQLALLSLILSLRMYPLLHGVIPNTVLYCGGKSTTSVERLFLIQISRASRILSFKMLLDRGLRTNLVYNFDNSKTPLSGQPVLGQAVMMNQSVGK